MVFMDNDFDDATTIRFQDTSYTLLVGNTGLSSEDLELKTNSSCFDPGSDSLFVPLC